MLSKNANLCLGKDTDIDFYDKQIDDNESLSSSNKNEIDVINGRISNIEANNNLTLNRLDTLEKANLDVKNGTLTQLNSQVTTLTVDSVNLGKQVKINTDNIANNLSTIQLHDSKIDANTIQINSNRNAINDLTSKVNTESTLVTNLYNKVTSIQAVNPSQAQIDKNTNDISTINSTLSSLSTKVTSNMIGNVSVDDFKKNICGSNQPTLTSIFDGCYDNNNQKYSKTSNASTGISGYDLGNAHLTQSYKNFDKILIVIANDNCNYEKYILWDKWKLEIAFAQGWRFGLDNGAYDGGFWDIYTSVQAGTQSHLLSTDTIWYVESQNCVLVDIYGVKY